MADKPTITPAPTTYKSYPPEVNDEGKTTEFKALAITDFVPDKGCETMMWKMAPPSLVGWDPGYNLFNPKDPQTRCHPAVATSWWDDEKTRNAEDRAATAYSIGPIVCPSPYTTAQTSIHPRLPRTLVGCCPSGYTFADWRVVGMTGQCESKIAVGDVFTYIYSTGTGTSTSWITSTSTVSTASTAYAIQINGWLLSQTSSSTSRPTSASGAVETQPATSAAASPEPTTAATGGFSTPAKIGLAVGISLSAAIILGGILAYFCIKRRRDRRAAGWLVAGHTELQGSHADKKVPPSAGDSSEYASLSPSSVSQWGTPPGVGLGIGSYRDRSPIPEHQQLHGMVPSTVPAMPVQMAPAELQGQATPPMELHGNSNMFAGSRAELPETMNMRYQGGEHEPKVLHPGYS